MTVTAPPQPRTRPVVRRAGTADAPALARVLADAFFDDPVSRWFVPSERRRRAASERSFLRLSLQAHVLPHGVAYTTPDVAGTALWVPSDAPRMTAFEELRMLPLLARTTRLHLRRSLRGLAALDAAHPRLPHWHLPQMGVVPAAQGQGIGSALLRPMLDRLDRSRMPAYLEATTARSRALYERHGFAGYDVLRLPDGPELVLMWREPQT